MSTGDTRWNAVAVLPTATSMSPLWPVTADYYDEDSIAYVLFKLNESRTKPTRVLTSAGSIEGWKLGRKLHLEHDQTRAYLGEYEIVGIHDFKSGERAGDVPNIKIKHCVLK